MTSARPIHVCFVAPKAYPLFNPTYKEVMGGAEVDLYLLATELACDPAYQVSFICADYGQPSREHIEGVTVLNSLTFRENPLAGAWKIWRAMKASRADLFVQEAVSWGTVLVFLFCRIHGRKFIYRTAHSQETDGSFVQTHSFLGRLFLFILRNADGLITQNHSDQLLLKTKFAIFSDTIFNSIRCHTRVPKDRRHILWVARSSRFKHPEYVLSLAASFPDETFVMICPKATEDNDYDNLQRRASAIANIRFIQRVDYNEIDGYFSEAKVFINTSDSEGFPNTFVQAAAAGAAIVSYQVNPDEFLTRFNCGLACRGDFEKLRQGLAFMLADQRYIEIGQNGRRYAEQHHDIKVIVEHYKNVFRKTGNP